MSIRVIDLTERGVVLAFYLLSAMALVDATLDRPDLGTVLVLVSNWAVVVFVVFRRRPQQLSRRPTDWLLAFAGTLAPLASGAPDGPSAVTHPVATTIIVLGLVVSLTAKLTLRRNFSVVPALGGIVVRGPYRLVRHPMYSGYVISQMGALLYGFTLRNLIAYTVCWVCLWLRTIREEALLTEAESYLAYRERVPFRLVPGVL